MPRRVDVAGGGDAGGGPQDWFQSLPVVTQYWLGATAVITIAANFNIIESHQTLFVWSKIQSNLELWRVFTCFCYAGGFSFPTVFKIYMQVIMSRQYEKSNPYNTGAGGGTADYIFALIFAAIVTMLTYPLVVPFLPMMPSFHNNLVFFVVYVWSKRNPEAQGNIWGFPIPAPYFPWAYIALSMFTGAPFNDMLHGLAVGHLYYFLVDVVPQVYGKDILVTPHFLIDQFGIGEFQAEAPAREPAPQQGAAGGGNGGGAVRGGGGYNWGGGQALGRT